MKADSKAEEYRLRLLKEYPPKTRGGLRYELINMGASLRTIKKDGSAGGYYTATDYPVLFGWGKPRPKIKKPPLVIDFKGYRYVRMKRQK